ncbi:SAM-dependent methyltransferase [Alkalilimnicola ehrlichii]|uniref:SAM-dependent methyltransferase n=2 Tax=Alkalilimnicola ehrlichii TaxID=351052 RepID=A0A3E0WZ93_9GAMM|nr:SAM-dependent methyltransferase [Alkalilimnicola ehrlichii]RFA37483.1 SAM-dependent methyltransferase [Alkalilimnicola ehrlichii]
MPSSLDQVPAPGPDAAALSARLQARIREAIGEAGGVLEFDRFMAMALYEPGLGYYSAGSTKFGAAGDFTTAPLISSLFSRTLARQCAQIMTAVGNDAILELGAGSGRMAVDILKELAALNALPERYMILEVSASLRQWQRELLQAEVPELLNRVSWLDALPEAPFKGVIIGNEVLDALPVKRFRKAAVDGVEELGVTVEGDNLVVRGMPAAPQTVATVAEIEQACGQPLDVGYSSEYCPALSAWIGSLADSLEQGAVLLIDYGYPRVEYYHPQRSMGTLVCHYRHRAHDDPLVLVGLQDITAFVDFTAVADAGRKAGLELLGFTPQAQFLLAGGMAEIVSEAMADADDAERLRLSQQVKALTLPGEMGERFKVMGLGRHCEIDMTGFALADHVARL